MSLERMAELDYGDCPLCMALISANGQAQDPGIFACPECRSMLVVRSRKGHRLILDEAPQIGEEGVE